MKELEQVKQLFLAPDIDEETRQENLEQITSWERSIIESENIVSWKEHDVTRNLLKEVKQHYKDFTLLLIHERNLTQEARLSIWAKQDACMFLIKLMDKDAKGTVEQIRKEINTAINATI